MSKQKRVQQTKRSGGGPFVWLPALLVLITLACSAFGWGAKEPARVIRIRRILPTLTPVTAAAMAAEAPPESLPVPSDPPDASQVANNQPGPAPTSPPQAAPTVAPPTVAAQANVQTQASVASAASPAAASETSPVPTPPPPVAPPAPAQDATAASSPPPASEFPAEAAGWRLMGVRTSIADTHATVVGKLVNNTGLAQTAVQVSGILYDEQNQVIEDGVEISSYVPVGIVPIGAHVPFELVVDSSKPIKHLDPYAVSRASDDSPREDFQFSALKQTTGSTGAYCLDGQIHNFGPPLENYLTIVAFAYDQQGKLAGFEEFSADSPQAVKDDQALPFEICIDSPGEQVTRHELRALGS
jgi:hypothetical protein